jgi:transcriptional regulator with XRE-family HTH domain
MGLGNLFKEKRVLLKYTQQDVANMTGLTRQTIASLEHSLDLNDISDDTITLVSDALDIDTDTLGVCEEDDEITQLVEANYHSTGARKKYCGASQFKAFMKCEAEALAEVMGEIDSINTKALMEGSYMDALIQGKNVIKQFRKDNPEVFTARGELKSEFKKAENAYERISKDQVFMDFIDGDKQTIMTGTINGVEFKVKPDILNLEKNRIVDLKYMKDFNYIWDDKDKCKKHFIEFWGYVIQGAIYREIVYQNTNVLCDFYIAGITKEEDTDYDVFNIASRDLDEALELVKEFAPHIQALKEGKEEPRQCGHCRYCRSVKELKGATIYTKYVDDLI